MRRGITRRNAPEIIENPGKTLCGSVIPENSEIFQKFDIQERTCENCFRMMSNDSVVGWVKILSWHIVELARPAAKRR